MTAEAAERAARARRWERATDWPLIIAGIIFLAAYAIPILRPDLPRGLVVMCLCADLDYVGDLRH